MYENTCDPFLYLNAKHNNNCVKKSKFLRSFVNL